MSYDPFMKNEMLREELHKLLAENLLAKNYDEVIKVLDVAKENDRDLYQELVDEMTNEELKEVELNKAIL